MGTNNYNQEVKVLIKEGCRIVATTFLSLLLPLSFLLLARLSVARYYFLSSVVDKKTNNEMTLLTSSSILNSYTTNTTTTTLLLILIILSVSLVTFASLLLITSSTTCHYHSWTLRSFRLYVACTLLFVVQICLSLGSINHVLTVDEAVIINSYMTLGMLVLPRRFFLLLGLHETTTFWNRNVVKTVVDEAISMKEYNYKYMKWVEKSIMAIAFGSLWWRRLRDEAEALVVLPRVTVELGMDVAAEDVLGWWLYYLTAVIGVIKVVKGFIWVTISFFNYYRSVSRKGGHVEC